MSNPFTAKAKKPKLRAFGSAKPATVNGKVNPFSVKAKKIDLKREELTRLDGQLEEAVARLEKAAAKETKLFITVDKLEGKKNSDRYHDAYRRWTASWKEVERANNTVHSMIVRRNTLLNGKEKHETRRRTRTRKDR